MTERFVEIKTILEQNQAQTAKQIRNKAVPMTNNKKFQNDQQQKSKSLNRINNIRDQK